MHVNTASKLKTSLLAVLLLVAISGFGQQGYFPEPKGWVNDFEHLFTAAQAKSVDSMAVVTMVHSRSGGENTGVQLAIVTVTDSMMGGYDEMLPYATTLANRWGVGDKKTNNGIVVAISKARRKVGISVGLGLEQYLTEAVCRKILDEKTIPALKRNDYAGAIIITLAELDKILSDAAAWH